MDRSGEARLEKPTKRSSNGAHIPLEVITEILVNLPVKSLLKFRAVCKSWCSLISTRQFVRKHMSRNITSTPKRVIHLRTKDLTLYSLHDSILVEESSPIEFPIENFNLYDCTNKEALSSFLKIMGYCDGLVCVKAYCNDDSLIFLWNPSTRDSRKLPYTPGVLRNHHFSCYGFGYDYNSDDYKVLIVVPPLDCYRDSSCKSMMYTLKTDTWRRIQDFPSDTRCLVWGHNPDRSATLVNGALHWMVKQTCNYLWVIISLNLTTETYMEVAKPDYYGVDQSSGIGIGVSNRDCLCLLVYNRAGRNYEFWVMKEYGVRESWTISAKISNRVEGGVYVLGLRPSTWFSENGKILFRPLAARELAIYNANNNSVTSLHQIPDDYSTAHGDVFVESLVSPYAYSNHRANDTNRLKINIGRMNRVVRNV